MTDEMISQVVVGLPNFAGFSIALLLMYRSLSQQQANNRELVNHVLECFRDRVSESNDK